ncbi:MAG: Radical SAM domain-containing protein [bacterium]|nr:MAG: Radical SAM domain-containing protein [bacterium]KAF0150391.1 MAG: Radical SAM domain-containing protein [bacterium]KAF0168948.1 MAG: Radical SAM domain-containing protein [bacterium]TXT18099.1 MAG: Radical SAM domain-containing protein [bacterium]
MSSPIHGRGAVSNPAHRFESLERQAEDDGWARDEEEAAAPATEVIEQLARTALTRNDSPDIPFDRSVNPYQGCEHGCVYCYARPSHAYHGLSPGLDFETKIIARPNIAERLREELARSGYRPAPVALGANTDPWQPVERGLGITRQVLEVLAETRHPLTLVTKSSLVERDLDLLAEMARDGLVHAAVSVCTLDADLARHLEPRAASPARRLKTLERLAGAGIPCAVLTAPVIPGLTDRDLERVLEAARDAGAGSAGYVLLRLPHELKQVFRDWLEVHHPLAAGHVMSLLRQMREGRENNAEFGLRQRGTGVFADLLARRFAVARHRFGLDGSLPLLDCGGFRPPGLGGQLDLF